MVRSKVQELVQGSHALLPLAAQALASQTEVVSNLLSTGNKERFRLLLSKVVEARVPAAVRHAAARGISNGAGGASPGAPLGAAAVSNAGDSALASTPSFPLELRRKRNARQHAPTAATAAAAATLYHKLIDSPRAPLRELTGPSTVADGVQLGAGAALAKGTTTAKGAATRAGGIAARSRGTAPATSAATLAKGAAVVKGAAARAKGADTIKAKIAAATKLHEELSKQQPTPELQAQVKAKLAALEKYDQARPIRTLLAMLQQRWSRVMAGTAGARV